MFDSLYRKYKEITIKSGPTGGGWLAFDRDSNLYFADSGSPDPWGYNLLIFAPPYDGPPKTISVKPNHNAQSVAIDPKTGVFALISNGHDVFYNPEVLFFRHG